MIQLSFRSILKFAILTLLSLVNFSSVQGQYKNNEKLVIVYPKPDQIFNDQNGYGLILGRVSNPANTLLINSEKVNLQQDGSFLHYAKVIQPEINDSIYLSPEKFIQGFF